MISTVINEQLGIKYPIFQGGMAWVADASLAAGVSNAGGLGIIAAMNSNGHHAYEPICTGSSSGSSRRESSGCYNRSRKPW